MGFEPTTPCGASDFESDRWPIRLPSGLTKFTRLKTSRQADQPASGDVATENMPAQKVLQACAAYSFQQHLQTACLLPLAVYCMPAADKPPSARNTRCRRRKYSPEFALPTSGTALPAQSLSRPKMQQAVDAIIQGPPP